MVRTPVAGRGDVLFFQWPRSADEGWSLSHRRVGGKNRRAIWQGVSSSYSRGGGALDRVLRGRYLKKGGATFDPLGRRLRNLRPNGSKVDPYGYYGKIVGRCNLGRGQRRPAQSSFSQIMSRSPTKFQIASNHFQELRLI